jgi:YD repeat-containing protein
LKQLVALKPTISIYLTLLICLMAGVIHASVTTSFRFQHPSSDLLTITEGSTPLSRTYDGRGRLKTFTTADGDLIQYLYDANNNLTRLTYPDGKQVNYTYNSCNLLATVTDWSNRITSYNYDRLGRLTGTTRPNGTSNQIAHDAASQLSSIKESSGTKLISYLAFKYDAAGQIQYRLRAPLVNSECQHSRTPQVIL